MRTKIILDSNEKWNAGGPFIVYLDFFYLLVFRLNIPIFELEHRVFKKAVHLVALHL